MTLTLSRENVHDDIEGVRTSDSGDVAGELGAHALNGFAPPVLPPDPSLLLTALVAPCDAEIL